MEIGSGEIVWRPDPRAAVSTLARFLEEHGLPDYPSLVARADADPEWFWDAVMRRFGVRFFEPYDRVLDASRGIAWPRWCPGGRTNVVLSCVDQHLETSRRDQEVLVWEGEDGSTRTWTYAELGAEVSSLAEGLRRLGIGRGDVVGLYMPMIPEAAAAYLAIAKIGAISLPLFSGFGEEAVASRLADADAVAIVTVDAASRRRTTAPMKAVVDRAAERLPTLRHVIVVRHRDEPVSWDAGRDRWWHDVCAPGAPSAPTESMEADSPFMLVYTSGTSGKPKGTLHTHCGFPTKLACDFGLCMDVQPGDRMLWMSDFGWVVGPLLVVVSTLLGGTMVMAEGAPDFPDRGRIWRLTQDHEVSVLGIAPTIVRGFMGSGGDAAASFDFASLRTTISTGEPWTPDAWMWFFEHVCRRRAPILNYSGGTEIGGGILGATHLHALKPCAFGGPLPGMGVDVVDERGHSVEPGNVGELVLRNPSIGLTRGLWKDPERYVQSYWGDYEGLWKQGDWALVDRDGLWYLLGRSDDTLKVSGRRTGPSEIEALLMGTGELVECAAVGVPDPVKGEVIVAVCVAGPHAEPGEHLATELSEAVVRGLGGPYRPAAVLFADDLPKTRNMKIVRRVVRAALLGRPPGDLSSLVNPEAVEGLAAAGARAKAGAGLPAGSPGRPA